MITAFYILLIILGIPVVYLILGFIIGLVGVIIDGPDKKFGLWTGLFLITIFWGIIPASYIWNLVTKFRKEH